MALSVIYVTVNGLRDENRRLGFLQWLSHLSSSVVCLQMCFLSAGTFGSVHSRAVTILYRPSFECCSVVCEFDGCFVLVVVWFLWCCLSCGLYLCSES